METAAFETDSLMKLLTDALRRGPGSPEWHDAIEYLKRDGIAGADEYRLLLTVRERLESGQHYREVRAGPAFTRELFDKLGDESAGAGVNRRPMTTVVVALVCLVALVGSVGLFVKFLSGISSVNTSDPLATQLFVTPLKTWTFNSGVPNDLKRAGAMKLDRWGGLKPAGDVEGADSAVVFSDQPIELTGGGACVEMGIKFQPGSTNYQLLMADSTPLSPTPGKNEIAVICDGTGIRVVDNGTSSDVRALPAGLHTLRLKVSDRRAIVELGAQQIWTGEHSLGKQGFVGVRLTKSAGKPQGVAVQSLRVLVP